MLRLALMGDLHYFGEENVELQQAKERFYERYLLQFLELEADLHISLGDLTHMGLAEEFESMYRLIRRSGKPFRHVLGNHDAYELPKAEVESLIAQPLNDVLETPEALLIFLDSTREMRPDDWSGYLTGKQLEWLQAHLQVSPEKPVMVFAHHPVYGTTTMSNDEKMHIDPSIDIRSILRSRAGGGFYFNGHNHIHSIVREEGWHFIQTAASLCHPSFRIVEIDGSEVRSSVVTAADPEILESARILFDKLPRYHRAPNAQGEAADRDQCFPLAAAPRI
ncbi:metallophosphoesterase [Paenibacillus sp. P25]|nr:metallophosphoesterase [Paenibacillus sp. P25]